MGVRELRAALADTLRRAEAGERVVVTVGGRPVAQVGPLGPTPGAVSLDDLVARGALVRAPRDDRPAEPPAIVAPWAGARLDRVLAEVR